MDKLSPDQLQSLYDTALEKLLVFLPQLFLAVLVLVVGWWVVRRIVKVVEAGLQRGSADATLSRFLLSLLSMGLKALLLISVASMIGIATTSFVAVLGAAGLAIGLALQGSLANFAGGVLILLFRPFRVGDFIEAQGVAGTVKEILIFNTIMKTPDNKRIIVPNGPLANDNITNFSAEDRRRVDLVFGIGYDDDLKRAKAVLERLIHEDERSQDDPAPLIVISELADSSVNITTRTWVQASDYWGFRFDLIERVKLAFDAEGISIPYPQQDVHLHQASNRQ
jgi:small conductance mechanosensitive channel